MQHDDAEESLGAFALGALSPLDHADLTAHLQQCDRCRQSLRELLPVVGALASAPDTVAPPPHLRERLTLAITEAPRGVVVYPRRRGPSRLVRRSLAGWVAAAALFLVSLGLSGWGLREHALLQASTATALAATTIGDGASGVVASARDRAPTLYVAHLPPPPAGQLYEAWVVHAGVPRASGIFVTSAAGIGGLVLTTIPAPGDLIAVTREPAPGGSTPTGPALLQGAVAS